MWKATVKGLLSRRGRLTLTALSVVLGVAFVAGTFILTDSTTRALEDPRGLRPLADVVVRGERAEGSPHANHMTGRERIPETLLAEIRRVEGVRAATPLLVGRALPADERGRPIQLGAGAAGVSWRAGPLSSYRLLAGRPPEGGDEVVLADDVARTLGYSLGDRVRVVLEGPPRQFTMVGTADFGSPDEILGEPVAAFHLATAQQLFAAEGELDAIDIGAEPGVSVEALRQGIAAAVPEGIDVASASMIVQEKVQARRVAFGDMRNALLSFAAVSLFVGAFIIFNTFSILVAQRTRELALLRALGATRRQVVASVAGEAAIVGVVSSVLGLGVGFLVAKALQGGVAVTSLESPATTTVLDPRTVLVAFAVGIGVTVGASLVPALRGSRVAPILALGSGGGGEHRLSRVRLVLGAAITALGGAGIAVGVGRGEGDLVLVGASAAITFIGVTLVSPWIVRPLVRGVGRMLVPVGGYPARLGQQNAVRNPKRTAATAAALTIGLGLVTLVGIFGESVTASGGQAEQMVLLVSALLGLSILIALFGIVNTLVLSVFERTRELGLLRAVGMTRGQVRWMIRWESVMVALFGTSLGIGLGILFGWALITPLAGRGLILSFPWLRLALYAAAAVAAGILAAVPPTRRAANLDVLRALAHE